MKAFYLFLITLVLISCEKSLTNFELEQKPVKQVINAFVGTDSLITVNLSYSQGILQPDLLRFIENASIEIRSNNQTIGELHHTSNGFYKAQTVFQEPTLTYQLEANAPNLPTARVALHFPAKPSIIDVDTFWVREIYDETYDSYELENLNFNIRVSDPEPSVSYFLVELFQETYQYFYVEETEQLDSIKVTQPIYMETRDRSALVSVSGSWTYERSTEDEQILYGSGFVYTDELFSKDDLNFSVETSYWELNPGYINAADILVSVKHISEPYYLFLRSYARYDQSLYNPFAEKVNVYTNVEGGLGIVGTYTRSTRPMKIHLRPRKEVYY